jgi:hypothetical protein
MRVQNIFSIKIAATSNAIIKPHVSPRVTGDFGRYTTQKEE